VLYRVQDEFAQDGFDITADVQSLSGRILVLCLDQWKREESRMGWEEVL
jgi:hypothetical protein